MKEQNTGECQDNRNLRLKFFWTGIIMAIKQEDIVNSEFELQRLAQLVGELETLEPEKRQLFFTQRIAGHVNTIKTARKEMQQTSMLAKLLERCKNAEVKFENKRREVIPQEAHEPRIILEPPPEELKPIGELVLAYNREDPRKHIVNGKLRQSPLQKEIIFIFGELVKRYPGSEKLAAIEKAYHKVVHSHIITLSKPYMQKKEAEKKRTRKGKR